MMKVTNCFMSKDSFSRARVIFNSVMAKNGCRVVLIALLMLVCGNVTMFAQLAENDIVTISVTTTDWSGNVTYHYLSAVENRNTVTDKNTPDKYSLWQVAKTNDQYSFKNVGASDKYLYITATRTNGKSWTVSLGTSDESGQNYTLTDNAELYYTAQDGKRTATCYIRYDNGWTSSRSNSSSLNNEKWTLKEDKGGLKGSFEPSEDIEFKNFDKTDAAAQAHETTVNFKIERTAASTYYQCVNRADAKISISSSTQNNTPINLSMLSVSWQFTPNSTTSKANCSNYENAAVTSRALLEYTRGEYTNNAQTITLPITITPVGSSPMEMKSADGIRWADHTDNLVVAFRDKDDVNETTYSVSLPVTRYSYHKEELPEFEVEIEPSTIEFSREGDTTTVNVSCTHQHGYTIRHMYGNVSDNTSDQTLDPIITIQETLNANPYFVTFTAKKIEDETQSDWLKVESLVDGVLTLSAPVNSTTRRHARLVGVFNYTNPEDDTDNHVKTEVLTVTQQIKDGSMILLPNKGHSGEDFAKNPFTGDDEQQVHTVEKTIYYTPNQAQIELRLAETAFRGYMRWYDYQTGCNPASNKIEADRTSWATAPRANNTSFIEINPPTPGTANSYGHSYGLYFTNDRGTITSPNVPVLKGWADGSKTHTIACDVSAHKDYKIGTDTIIEPTLSYRQLFHLRPATEMADKFKAAAQKTDGNQFLENYEYTAPSGKTVMLSTQFRYKSFTKPRNSHSSEFCYYYYKNGTSGELGQVGVTADVTAKWYKVNGATLTEVQNPTYPTFDYLQIAGQEANTEAEYQLIVSDVHGGKDLKIARFVVKFVDVNTHGPVNSIMTQADIAARYQILEYNDFSFGASAPGTGNMTHLYKHLPWGESTYGYFYPTNVANECDRQNTDIPYYGEYALMNYYSKNWAGGAQHGGADKGYALFVDGTTEPGLVASISTDAVICSGQTLYCSVWLMNPRKNNQGGTPPVFRCNIQGRHKGDADWKDVGVYYVGAWANYDQNWKQVVFPIQSKVSYDETRVSVYNFGTGGDGNDFFLDDLCLFVSPLPLAAYQATMGCRSYTDNTTTSTAVVVRLDYAQLNKELQGNFAYYQIFNVTDNRVVKLKTIDTSNQIVPAYYADTTANEAYGSVRIPAKDYIPGTGDVIATGGLQTYIEGLIENNTRHGKCYVRDTVNNKWFLYVIHIVPNTQQNVSAADADIYLEKDKEYLLRIAHAPGELSSAACASTTELHATTDTYVELRDDRDGVERVDCKELLCANNHYFLDVKVQNTLAPSVGGTLETVEALVHADWLVGAAFDDLYCNSRSMTEAQKDTADAAFMAEYKCERNALRQAISDMRQLPPNPNYQQTDPTKLKTTTYFDATELALIQRLCAEGKLKLYQTTSMFYMGSEEIVRYWIYPVAEDAKVTFNGQEYKLYDCDEPLWVKLKSQHSEYAVNLSPIDIANQKPNERLMLPSIRILEGTKQVTIPVKQLLGRTNLHSTLSPTREEIIFNYKEPIENVLEYVDLSNNRIDIVDAPTTLEPGKDYLMRMAFYDKDGNVYINGHPDSCRVGFVYFYLSIVPKVVQWTGDASAVWGNDANWKARKADGTLMDVGFAPLPKTNVIIPTLPADKPYPIVTTDNHYPMDVNHLPNACNDIYFAPDAMIHNQHLLQYNKAFVDMKIKAANWNSMAPPLKGMYTGDMFVPHDGYNGSGVSNKEYMSLKDNSQYPFVVNSFQGTRTSKAPYVFWQSLYNKRATIYHENGNQSHPALTTTAIFAQTNSLGQPLPPGTGYQVLGFGPTHGTEDEIIVRLPKPDTYYSYYYSNGTVSDQRAYVEHSSKLAFEPDANGDMYITLTNDLSSNQFMFGNPAMTNIDMKKFLEDPYNAPKLANKYYTMSESSWKAENWFTMEHSGSGELAPMRSVLLELASGEATSITVKLSKTHLVGYTEPVPAGVVARKNIVEEESGETQLMTIYATSEGGQARCILASNAYAQDIYNNEEDALFISSGVEEGVNSATATSPVNMYTVSEQVPMMVDVRENIDTVPVSMLVHDSYRTEKVKFSFYLSINWNKECYFYDAVTGERYRIMDGLWLEMDMPLNHATRYFITGPDHTTNSGVVTNTTNPNVAPLQVWAYSEQAGEITVCSNDIIQSVTIYDIAGHIIARQTLDLLYNQVSLPVGQGIHIAEVTLRDNSKHYTRTIVK